MPWFQKKQKQKQKIKGKPKCTICLTERTFIDKIKDKYDLESELENHFQFFADWCYKRTWRLIVWGAEKILKI